MTFVAEDIISNDIPWLKLVVSFSILVYTLHTYLDIRQLKVREIVLMFTWLPAGLSSARRLPCSL